MRATLGKIDNLRTEENQNLHEIPKTLESRKSLRVLILCPQSMEDIATTGNINQYQSITKPEQNWLPMSGI